MTFLTFVNFFLVDPKNGFEDSLNESKCKFVYHCPIILGILIGVNYLYDIISLNGY